MISYAIQNKRERYEIKSRYIEIPLRLLVNNFHLQKTKKNTFPTQNQQVRKHACARKPIFEGKKLKKKKKEFLYSGNRCEIL